MNDLHTTFLVVDHHPDSRFLLVKCLKRKFPAATILEAEEGDPAIELARDEAITAIVTHRTREYLGAELVALFREANPTAPIVMVSSIDRTGAALAAGANQFLLYDEWLRLGSVMKALLGQTDVNEVVDGSAADAGGRPGEGIDLPNMVRPLPDLPISDRQIPDNGPRQV